MAITKNNCGCETDQSSLCGFDHINGELHHDCDYRPVVHTTTRNKGYCKVITREFPLQSRKLISSKSDALTLVVKYRQNEIESIRLKTFDIRSNSTQWHDLSLDDLNTFINVFSAVKNDIEPDSKDVFLF